MTLQRIFPFRRISVDRMVSGVSRIWWQLDPLFQETGPYHFQLQVGNTGLDEALDWQNAGDPVVNGFYAEDAVPRAIGVLNTLNYRITLSTPDNEYVSPPAPALGRLNEKDWLTAREIIRKEKLRHGKVSVAGFLIKALRYGKLCARCQDIMTGEPGDSDCPLCLGTGYESGFHPAVPMQCWDLSLKLIQETIDNNMKGTTAERADITARVIGFPGIQRSDVWVNSHTDDRWFVKGIRVIAAIRGVPLVCDVNMGLLAYSNAYYNLPLEPPAVVAFIPKAGAGCVAVTADYLLNAALRYADINNEFISGVIVTAYYKQDYDAAYPVKVDKANIVASAITDIYGDWETALHLDPGTYILVYEKENVYGPDAIELTVLDPCIAIPETCPTPPVLNVYEDFWDI